LSETRQYLATTLLERTPEDCGPAVAPWKAWVLVGWMVLAVVFWAVRMLGW
jgi:hypothetical protein